MLVFFEGITGPLRDMERNNKQTLKWEDVDATIWANPKASARLSSCEGTKIIAHMHTMKSRVGQGSEAESVHTRRLDLW